MLDYKKHPWKRLMSVSEEIRVLPCGDSALTIEFGETVDPVLNARVLVSKDA